MADTEILEAIRIIDAKIASLQEARNRLADAFGVSDDSYQKAASSTTPRNIQSVSAPHASGHGPPKGRKKQLAQFLLEHGPTSRADIAANSVLPDGTVSFCLSNKRFFSRMEDGKWDLTAFSRRELERDKQWSSEAEKTASEEQ